MPKYRGSARVGQMVHKQNIAKRYQASKLYFEAKVSPGTVLWSDGNGKAFISSAEHTEETNTATFPYLKLDSNLALSKPISKLKSGLTITVGDDTVYSSLNAYATVLGLPDGTKKAVSFTQTQLQSGKWLTYQDTQDYTGNIGSVKVRALDDKTLQFESINGALQSTLQSTAISALGTNYWLIITAVTAY